MKVLSDFEFSNSWQVVELELKQGVKYEILQNLGSFTPGEMVIFLGYEDIDNHYGNFVFQKIDGEIVEFHGDYCSTNHSSYLKIQNALV